MGASIFYIKDWGWVGVGTTKAGVAKVYLPKSHEKELEDLLQKFWDDTNMQLAIELSVRIREYLHGSPVSFDDIKVDLSEVKELYRPILEQLRFRIKLGQTITYKGLAKICGIPTGARVVAKAMASNPVPLIIPCHRVIMSNGTLGGYSGGIQLKARLLALEQRLVQLTS